MYWQFVLLETNLGEGVKCELIGLTKFHFHLTSSTHNTWPLCSLDWWGNGGPWSSDIEEGKV